MSRPYFLLVSQSDRVWSVQFGDYSRAVVEQERRDVIDSDTRPRNQQEPLRVIRVETDTQAACNEAVAKLNA